MVCLMLRMCQTAQPRWTITVVEKFFEALSHCCKSLPRCLVIDGFGGITMNFFICFAFVNLFKFCIMMILVLWNFSQNIPLNFSFIYSWFKKSYIFYYFLLIIFLIAQFLSTFNVCFFEQLCSIVYRFEIWRLS